MTAVVAGAARASRPAPMGERPHLLSVGTVARPHGVLGAVKVSCAAEHVPFLKGRPELVVGGRTLRVARVQETPKGPIVTFEGVDDRNAAEDLRGALVEAARDALPEPGAEEYFVADLAGCEVRAGGMRVGEVREARVLPANTVLAIVLDRGGELLAPFTRQAVPVVDVDAGFVEVDAHFLGIDVDVDGPQHVDDEDDDLEGPQ